MRPVQTPNKPFVILYSFAMLESYKPMIVHVT